MKVPSIQQRKNIVKSFKYGQSTVALAFKYGVTVNYIEDVIRFAMQEEAK